jgi:hypothetical protein
MLRTPQFIAQNTVFVSPVLTGNDMGGIYPNIHLGVSRVHFLAYFSSNSRTAGMI